MLRQFNNRHGFAMGAVITSLFLLSSVVALGTKATDAVRSAQRYFSGSGVKNNMSVVRDFLIQDSTTSVSAGGVTYYILRKEAAGNAIPAAIPVNNTDVYGTPYVYCTWDISGTNANPLYSQNLYDPPTSPSTAGQIGRIISGGYDRVVQTSCSDVSAQSDDIVLDINSTSSTTSMGGMGGWKDVGSHVLQLNPSANIGVGLTIAPTHRVEMAAGTTAAEGLALGDVEIFRTAANTLQVNVAGGAFNINAGTIQNSGSNVISAGSWVGNAVSADHGGTGQTAYDVGDMLYASGAATLSKLPAGAAGLVLTSNGPGVAPSWQAGSAGWTRDAKFNLKAGDNALSGITTGTYNIGIGDSALLSNTVGANQIAIGTNAARLIDNVAATPNIAIGQDAFYGGHATAANNSAYNSIAIGYKALYGTAGTASVGHDNTAIGNNSLNKNTSGNFNTAVGDMSLYTNTTGSNNSAFGISALKLVSTGQYNTAVGSIALMNATANFNTAIGSSAGQYTTSGTDNVAVGYSALLRNTTGSGQIAIGSFAGKNIVNVTANSPNIAIGQQALFGGDTVTVDNNTANNNIAMGYQSMYGTGGTASTGSNNFAAGYQTLRNATTAHNNIAIGFQALVNNATGNGNTAIGRESLQGNTGGIYNTAIGYWSMRNSTGSNNTAIGFGTLYSNGAGSGNVAIGYQTLQSNTTGLDQIAIGSNTSNYIVNSTANLPNIAIGKEALYGGDSVTPANNTAYNNIAIGYRAIYGTAGTASTGYNNFAAGNQALNKNTSGIENTSIGFSSMLANTIGQYNIAIGRSSLVANTSGGYNTALGPWSLQSNTTGFDQIAIGRYAASAIVNTTVNSPNIALGPYALYGGHATAANNTAYNNIAIGYQSMYGTAGIASTGTNNFAAGPSTLSKLTSGDSNTAIINSAMLNNTTGSSNVAIGLSSLYTNTTGSYNTAIGNSALYFNLTGSYNTAIGFAALTFNTGSDQLAIGYRAAYSIKNVTANSPNIAFGKEALYGGHGVAANNTASNNIAMGYQALYGTVGVASTGVSNFAAGSTALNKNSSGSYNVAIGNNALFSNTAGTNQIAIGMNAAYQMDSTSANTTNIAIGPYALYGGHATAANNTGYHNTAIGYQAMYGTAGLATTGVGNFAVGYRSLQMITTGSDNISVGRQALQKNTSGDFNTALGYFSLTNNTTGVQNVAIGYNSLLSNSTGNDHIAIGQSSAKMMNSVTVDSPNIAFGKESLYGGHATASNNTGYNNVAMGFQSMYGTLGVALTGTDNFSVGNRALTLITSGTANTAIGFNSQIRNLSGNNNVGIGYQTLYFNTGSDQLALGYRAALFMTNVTAGSPNIAFGKEALYGGDTVTPGNNTGYGNIAVGYQTMYGIPATASTGYYNTAIGQSSMVTNTSGNRNTAFGAFALNKSTTGIYNSAIGFNSLFTTADGTHNVSAGAYSMEKNSSGSHNVSIGVQSMNEHTTGSYNTAIGRMAGYGTGIGSGFDVKAETRITLLGSSSTISTAGITYATAIGAGAQVGASNTIVLGRTTDYVAIGATTANDGTQWKLYVGGDVKITGTGWITGGVWQNSDRRLKKDFRALVSPLSVISQLEPMSYYWKDPKSDPRRQFGFIAQEIQKVLPELVSINSDGYLGVNYVGVVPWLVGAINEMNRTMIKVSAVQVVKQTSPTGRTSVAWKYDGDEATLFSVSKEKEGDDNAQGYLSAKDVYLSSKGKWASEAIGGGVKFLSQPVRMFEGDYPTAYIYLDTAAWVPKDATAAILSVDVDGQGTVAARAKGQNQEQIAKSGQIIVPLNGGALEWQARIAAGSKTRINLVGWAN